MTRFLGIIDYLNDISYDNCIEKTYNNLKDKFDITHKLDIFKTRNICLSNALIHKSFEKDKYVMMYTGNILNISEVRKKLVDKGYTFTTKTKLKKEKIIPIEYIDYYLNGEILLTSYYEYEEKFLDYLEGNFAICIYDKTKDILFLARDKIGINTLYYTNNNSSFKFSTNLKELLNIPNTNVSLNKDKMLEIMLHYNNDNSTYFKDIYELLPGHYAILTKESFTTFKYTKDSVKNNIHDKKEFNKIMSKTLKLYTKECNVIVDTTNCSDIFSCVKKDITVLSYKNKDKKIFKKNIYDLIKLTDIPNIHYTDLKLYSMLYDVKNKGIDKCIFYFNPKEYYCNIDTDLIKKTVKKDILKNISINNNTLPYTNILNKIYNFSQSINLNVLLPDFDYIVSQNMNDNNDVKNNIVYEIEYVEYIKNEVNKIVENNDCKIGNFFNLDYIKELLTTDLNNNVISILEYLLQIEYWFDVYDIKL